MNCPNCAPKDTPLPWINKHKNVYQELSIALVIFIALALTGWKLGLFSLATQTTGSPSLWIVLLVGLTAGLSTCMALIGGLVLGISARHAEKHPEATPLQKFRPHLFFNLGRLGSYFLLGGVLGMIGKTFQLSGTLLGILTLIVGIVMLWLGLQLTEIFPKLSRLSLSFGIKIREHTEYSHGNALLVGALTFFLPCGFTQAIQLYAVSTGNFWSGAMIMSVFALGTAPGLLGIGGLSSIFKGKAARVFIKLAGIAVMVFAVNNISGGLKVAGWYGVLAGSGVGTQTQDPNVTLEDGIQTVRMSQTARGYRPNKITIVKDIPVKWIIISDGSLSCASSLISPQLRVQKFLEKGENIIEFTPTEMGVINFSCSMGMYSGSFTVIENSVEDCENETTCPIQ